MNLLDTESPAGRAIELVSDLVKQGRMSKAEARVIEDLVWHSAMPESLRRNAIVRGHPPGTDTEMRPMWPFTTPKPMRDYDGRQSAFSAAPISRETRVVCSVTGRDLGPSD